MTCKRCGLYPPNYCQVCLMAIEDHNKNLRARTIQLEALNAELLEACKASLIELSPMADQIICPRDNGLRRLVNRLQAAIAQTQP